MITIKNTLEIYKYKPELQDKAQYFKSESDLLKQLKKDMQDDIKIIGMTTYVTESDEFLLDESISMGETVLLEFSIPQAISTLTELLNQNK
tara:strand:+ start:231 stop:503 length:273 start_codon:yes stop_codon:yes gene_type:complete